MIVAEKPAPGSSQPSLRTQALHGLGWASMGTVIRAVLQFGVLAVLARLLSPADFGLVGAALVAVGISSLFSQMGVGSAVVQQRELDEKHIDTAVFISLVFAGITFVAFLCGSSLIEALFRMPGLGVIVKWLSLIFPVIGFAVVPESLLQRRLEFRKLAMCDVISSVFGYALVTIVAALLTHSYVALVVGFLSQGLLRSILVNWYARAPFHPRWHRDAGTQLLNFSFLFTASQFGNYLAVNSDNFLVGRFLGSAPLGIYGRAYQIMVAPASLVGDTIDKVLYPTVSQVSDSQDRMSRIFGRGNRLLAAIFLPASGALCILSREIVLLLLGPKWLEVSLPLSLFSLVLFFRTTPKLSNTFIKATGQVDKLAVYQVIYAVSVVLLASIGLSHGIAGVCTGVLVAIIIFYLLMTGCALRITGTSWDAYLRLHVPAALLALLVTGVTALLAGWMRQSHWAPLFILGVSMILAGLVIAGLLWSLPETFLGEDGRAIRSGWKAYLRGGARPGNLASVPLTPP